MEGVSVIVLRGAQAEAWAGWASGPQEAWTLQHARGPRAWLEGKAWDSGPGPRHSPSAQAAQSPVDVPLQ